MVKFAWITVSFVIVAASAHASDLSTVMGKPDGSLDFVQAMVEREVNFVDAADAPEAEVTTSIYSLLSRKGVQTTTSVEILNRPGDTTMERLLKGLKLGAQYSPVVFTSIGPIQEEACELLAGIPASAFVVVAGNSGMTLDPADFPSCLAGNILFVTAYDQRNGTLPGYANRGAPVRIGAASMNIPTIGPEGKPRTYSSTSMGAAQVAGQLAVFARGHSELRGAELVERFLQESTIRVPALDGAIVGGLVLAE